MWYAKPSPMIPNRHWTPSSKMTFDKVRNINQFGDSALFPLPSLSKLEHSTNPLAMGYGTVLPPWLLLSWLRTSSQSKLFPKRHVVDYSNSLGPQLNNDRPLDLRLSKPELMVSMRKSQTNTPGQYLPSEQVSDTMTQSDTSQSTEENLIGVRNEAQTFLTHAVSSLRQPNLTINPITFSRPTVQRSWLSATKQQHKQKLRAEPTANDRSNTEQHLLTKIVGSGPGKQPVTRCHQCKLLFPTLMELNTHFVIEHASILRTEFEHTKSWKSHAVETLCIKDFDMVATKPGEIDAAGYPCPFCEYFAKWPTELQKHIMVHSKERPHSCVICGLSYKWKWDLGRHFDKSHHKAMNPYKKNGFATTITTTTPTTPLAVSPTKTARSGKRLATPTTAMKQSLQRKNKLHNKIPKVAKINSSYVEHNCHHEQHQQTSKLATSTPNGKCDLERLNMHMNPANHLRHGQWSMTSMINGEEFSMNDSDTANYWLSSNAFDMESKPPFTLTPKLSTESGYGSPIPLHMPSYQCDTIASSSFSL